MPLATGMRLDHYEVIDILGSGGMGEVYRARDTRLPREVAIKVSGQAFNDRFAREARVIASLNHPNICTLFDVGPNYLVMELVDGDTLADRIKQGALPLEEASRIAKQIADALDYAHEHGVIHRDLKPANVKVRPDGVVKVLDFGLAKAMQAQNSDEVATVTMDATQAGAILGTPNYMSPEQALGRPTDKRADTWAFGIVFYEMLSGAKPFNGPTVQESIAATLRDTPDLSKVPSQVRRLLRRCLEKDPANRLKHLGDVMSLIDEPPSGELPPGSVRLPISSKARPNWLWPALAAIGLIAAAVLAFLHFTEQPPLQESLRFEFNLPRNTTPDRYGAFSLSPDGRSIVFSASDRQGTRLWLRRLDATALTPLNALISGGSFAPIWSPDSRFILYSDGTKVWKLEIAGGQPVQLCDKCMALGGSWHDNGSILIGNLSSIALIPPNGGPPVDLVTADRSPARQSSPEAAIHPVWLPDGKRFLYMFATGSGTSREFGVRIGSMDLKPAGQSKDWFLETYSAVQLLPATATSPMQLLFVRGETPTLMAVEFDSAKPAMVGEPVPVLSQLAGVQDLGWSAFAASADGHLVYRTAAPSNLQQLTWLDRSGRIVSTVGDPANQSNVTLSPDGRRVVVAITNDNQADLWIVDLNTGARTRLTYESGNEVQPVWSPDGVSIYYASQRDGHQGIYRRASNGVGKEERIQELTAGGTPNLSDISSDGRLFFHTSVKQEMGTDIFAISLKPNSEPQPVVQTPFAEVAARLSPDGRYFLYRSNESGRGEIYVQATPGGGAAPGKWLVSKDGGNGMVRWRRDGREVLFLSNDGQVMAADVTSFNPFASALPHKLFDVPQQFKTYFNGGVPGVRVDVTPDNQRFLFALPTAGESDSAFQVNTNFRAGLPKYPSQR